MLLLVLHPGGDQKVPLSLVPEFGVEREASRVLVSEHGLSVHGTWLSGLRLWVGPLAPLTGKPRLRSSAAASLGVGVTWASELLRNSWVTPALSTLGRMNPIPQMASIVEPHTSEQI